jgi:hypothetical protein
LQHHLFLHRLNRAAHRLNWAGHRRPAFLIAVLTNEDQVIQTLGLMALLAACCNLR